jgi:serine/threonine protein kinase
LDAVGGYQLLGRLSENRPVSVWKGHDPAHERDVALKRVELTTDEAITRLRRQARVLAGISHPGIVEVLELVEEGDHAWLVEVWIDGIPLSLILERGGPLTAAQATAVIGDALLGLAYAHEQGLVHGNIATEALLLDSAGRTRLSDFGAPIGQPIRPVTPSSDVHALAALLADLAPDAPEAIRSAIAHTIAGPSSADDFCRELETAAAASFGPAWREVAVSGRVLESLAERVVEAPMHPVEEPAVIASPARDDVQVRSAVRVHTPSGDPGVRRYFESRAIRGNRPGRNASWLVPLLAGVVVVAAIIILVLSRQVTKDKGSNPGLKFDGRYTVVTTLQTAGIGADAGKAPRSVLTDVWSVDASCTSASACTETVKPSAGMPFRLVLHDGRWTGALAMQTAAGCVGAYSFVLNRDPNTAAGTRLVGSMIGVFGGCGQLGTENATVVVSKK